MKKKMMSLGLAVVMCLSLCVPAFAADTESPNNALETKLITSEDAMPALSTNNELTRSTLQEDSRAQWEANTQAVLESAYSQNVENITEDADYITFEFEAPDDVISDTGYIDRVEYIKPESKLASSQYSRKLTWMYGWGDGYYSLEEKSGDWNMAKDLTLAVAGLSNKISVYTFAISYLGIMANHFKPTTPVHAKNTAQYYLMNKIGQIKDPTTGLWGMYAYVGCRRAFYRTLLEEKSSYDYYTTLGVKETHANSQTNPSNYDKIEYKTNFLDNSWILDKAESVYSSCSRIYMDVFGLPKYFSDTVPAA